jgi:hypothetical protein
MDFQGNKKMTRGHEFDPMEQRLRDEADRLLLSHGGEPPTSALVAEHRRRLRVRRVTRTVCCAAGVLLLLGTAGLVGALWPENRLADHPPAPKRARSIVPRVNETNDHQPGGRPFNDSLAKPSPGEPLLTLVAPASDVAHGSPVVPVFITVPEGDRQRVIAAGIYVPERTQEVDLSNLSPAEQHAVRQVLDIPEDQIPRETF